MNSKAQAWYLDFAVALLLFIVTLVAYFGYTSNFQKEERGELDTLITDVQGVSSSLAISGYPAGWDNTSVIRIGIADEQRLNSTKLRSFKKLNYTKSKKLLAAPYDYFVFFADDKNSILNIKSVCGVGFPLVNLTYNIKSAYYYQDDVTDFKLRDFMKNTFNADIYFKDQNNDIYGLDGLISNISKYDLIVFEHALMSGGDYNDNYRPLNNYTARGGLFIISGELTTGGSGPDINGIRFWKKTGQSEPERVAIVNNTDLYLTFNVGDQITFNQYYYVTNDKPPLPTIETDPNDNDYNPFPAVNFKIIASFNKTPEDYAIATWRYGNGTVYFYSDFDVGYPYGDFVALVQDSISSAVERTCTQINLTKINAKKLVKAERYLSYNSKVVKMVIYMWQ